MGRGPRTEGIGLEKTKIKPDRGFIKVNEYMQTDEPGIYAIGDIVAGMPQLAHSGSMAGLVATAKIAGKYARPIKRDRIPGCTYTEPQIGSVGLTEAKAKELGHTVKVGKFPFVGNSKATIVDSHDGFVKVVADAKYGEILGVHIIGPQATELIAEAVTAMELEATVEEMMWTIHAHPTLCRSHARRLQQRGRHGDQRLGEEMTSSHSEIASEIWFVAGLATFQAQFMTISCCPDSIETKALPSRAPACPAAGRRARRKKRHSKIFATQFANDLDAVVELTKGQVVREVEVAAS